MRFRIQTNDYKYHVYETAISNLIDFLIALEDFDLITLSGTRYSIGSILHIEEL